MRIFLSYSSHQFALAEQLAVALQAEHHEVFLDRASLAPGREYNAHIREAIRRADVMVFLISARSVSPGSYALFELQVAIEQWKTADRRVIPVMTEPVPSESLPAFLRAVTILEPSGNLVAEIAHAVARVRRGRRRPLVALAGLGAAGAIVGIAVVAGRLGAGSNGAPAATAGSSTETTGGPQLGFEAQAWMVKQGVAPWFFPEDAEAIAKIGLYEGQKIPERARTALDATFLKLMQSFRPEALNFLKVLGGEALGPVLIAIPPDRQEFLLGLELDSSQDDLGNAFTASGLTPYSNRQVGNGTLYLAAFVADHPFAVAFVDVATQKTAASRYRKILLVGSEHRVEAAMIRHANATVTLPPQAKQLSAIAEFKSNWLVWHQSSRAAPLDPPLKLPPPKSVVLGTSEIVISPWGMPQASLTQTSEQPPVVQALVSLGYEDAATAKRAGGLVENGRKLLASKLVKPCGRGVEHMVALAMGPESLAFAYLLLDTVRVGTTDDRLTLFVDSAYLDSTKFASTSELILNNLLVCNTDEHDRPLVPASAALKASVIEALDHGRHVDPDDTLGNQLAVVSDPATALLPVILEHRRTFESLKSGMNMVMISALRPEQLDDLLTHGIPRISVLTEKLDPSGANAAAAQGLLGAVIMAASEPSTFRRLLERYRAVAPPVALIDVTTELLCKESGISGVHWDSVLRFLDRPATALGHALLRSIASCAIVSPDIGLARLVALHASIPAGAVTMLPEAFRDALELFPETREAFKAGVAALPPGELRSQLQRAMTAD